MSTKSERKPTKLFVAAIDFGTTYSEYAFSPKSQKEKVRTNVWRGGTLASLKAPTVLLLNSDQTLNSFGYDAEDVYTNLVKKNTYKEYYYFHRFKMILRESKDINESTKIKDITGKSLDALTVFSMSIKYLKGHMLRQIENEISGILERDIHYILTVPAIWDERSKLFMRKAAIQAGIDSNRLGIALEPEAASVFCQTLLFGAEDEGQSALKEPGATYVVADLGGGTADITVHARTENGKLKEIYPASGGEWGGKNVEENFLEFLKIIIGEKVFEQFCTDEMEDFMELLRDFENLKRKFVTTATNASLRIPVVLDEIIEKHKNFSTFRQLWNASKDHSKDIKFDKGKLIFPSKEFEKFFQPVVQGILQQLEKIFMDEKVKNVDKILMVGGFSDCKLVRDAVKRTFPKKTVITPNEAGLIVLKGAVYFGHLDEPISIRVSRYTYGIQSWPEFDSKIHPQTKMTTVDRVQRCRDVFFKFVTRGEEVKPGHCMSQTFQVLKPDEDSLECIVYASDEEDPKFVDSPGCRAVMKLTIPLQAISLNSKKSLEIEESLIFGETELKCCAKERNTGKDFEVKCLLGSH